AARVERDALADEHQGPLLFNRLLVFENDEPGRLFAPLRDGQERAHAEALDLGAIEDTNLDVGKLLAEFLCSFGEIARRADVAGQVAEVLGTVHTVCNGKAP